MEMRRLEDGSSLVTDIRLCLVVFDGNQTA